ncbi:hypothetical protein HY312_01870 [Candidatus Saccharibacteria bacterium]|nr:hypothetical protein [Candidatus Saccharibacteria bacterium]
MRPNEKQQKYRLLADKKGRQVKTAPGGASYILTPYQLLFRSATAGVAAGAPDGH